MSIIRNIHSIYFIGIGGIGMSALARFASLKGIAVYGYDKTKTSLTKQLVEEGIHITYTDEVLEIPTTIQDKKHLLVVYTPAIPASNNILTWFKNEQFQMMKRAQFLGEVTKDTLCLAVAGTHGKTTTSAILGHLLVSCDMPVTAFLGGISENYKSNFVSKGTEITVVEADEFDRSFLQLRPDIACITSMDADHLDIYGNENSIQEAFLAFSDLIPNKDNLLFKKGLKLSGKSVAIEAEADFKAENVRIENGAYVFDLSTPTEILKDLQFYLPGHHNLHNAVTAIGMALLAGVSPECLPAAISSFEGVERRFSYKIRTNNLVLIDDYAHHPTELNALFQAVSEMYPHDKKQIIFQPHLFSRTRDFAKGFAESLSQFDEVSLLDIYPAREEPMDGVTSSWLLEMIKLCIAKSSRRNGSVPNLIKKSEIITELEDSDCRIKLLVGAGDIGAEVSEITKKMRHEN